MRRASDFSMSKDHYNQNEVNLMNTFRELWEQHILWTRSFIISTAANLEDLNSVVSRLLQNPTDFANVLRPFYGKENASKFEALLQQHLAIAGKLVNDAKAGDGVAVAEDNKKWFENADEIATFLSSINPYWSKKEWQELLYDHLRMTEKEAVLRLGGKYEEDVKLFDSIEDEALKMADLMSSGIIKQFKY